MHLIVSVQRQTMAWEVRPPSLSISQVHTPEHNPEVHPTGLLGMMDPPTSVASPATGHVFATPEPPSTRPIYGPFTRRLLCLRTCINKMVNWQDPSLL